MAETFKFLEDRSATDSLRVVIEAREKLAEVPADYRFLTLNTSPAKDTQRQIYKLLAKYRTTFSASGHEIKSLYLYSSAPGTGKTTTAIALLNEFIIARVINSFKQSERPSSLPAYFVDVNELQTLFNKFNRPRVPEREASKAASKYYTILAKGTCASFALLDDVGVRTATEAFRSDIHTLINERVTTKKPTVYTSNIAPEQLSQVFDGRLADRIMDQCLPLHFEGGSQRGMRK
ncbi:DNA replication protein [Listeria floridensis FSL S10-1187]|uniref:DNA replication protein n=1 Tax=Listeria floridensis FSL S10-1187 TaxID=1265817 RepID=A0ABN0RB47_9LIST|nr:DNA replication protein [Listeria floridensis]EUJ23451.1 DNA replication protein [Listeria floridensis FSL S10-1187]